MSHSPSEILRKYNLQPQKRYGQCFLHDKSVIQRIIDASQLTASDFVIEIGGGLGVLSEALAQTAQSLVVIETDANLIPVLTETLAPYSNTTIQHADALTVTFSDLFTQGVSAAHIVGNLPYNISSPLIFRILSQRQQLRTCTIMLQKEVATRLCAKPGGKDYGVPSILCQQYAVTEYCFHVGRGAFTPAPNVDSAIVRLTLRNQPLAPADEALFAEIVHAGFAKRRKMLQGALRSRFTTQQVTTALDQAGIDGKRRGETLSIAEFAALTNAMQQVLCDTGD